MARTWLADRWVRDATVTMPDGSTMKVSPTSAQLKSLKTLPEHFRTAKFMQGSRWSVGWYEDADDGGQRQRSQLFARRAAAESFQAELEDDIRSGRYIDPTARAKPFSEAAEAWLTAKANIKDSSWRRYRRELDTYVIPKWGTRGIGSITRTEIDEWVRELAEGRAPHDFNNERFSKPKKPRPMAPSYLKHVVGATFGGVLRHCVIEQWIGRTPLANVSLPRDERDIEDDLPHMNYAEIEAAAGAAEDIYGSASDRLLLLTLAYSGPRVGEATALKVKDLDLPRKRARIMRTWTVNREGHRKIGPAKTWEKRWIPLTQFVVDGLKELTKHRGPEDWVFTSQRGLAVDGKNWYNRVWIKARAAVGLPDHISVHDLRHVAATNAIAAGADVKLVQKMLGHKDATETLNTYAHLFPDRVDEVVSLLETRRSDALRLAA